MIKGYHYCWQKLTQPFGLGKLRIITTLASPVKKLIISLCYNTLYWMGYLSICCLECFSYLTSLHCWIFHKTFNDGSFISTCCMDKKYIFLLTTMESWCSMPHSITYISDIVTVGVNPFISGGNWGTCRKTLTCHKVTANFIT